MIADEIYQGYVTEEKGSWHRQHLGASQLGNPCARAVWYGLHWCSKPSFTENGRILRLFQTGNLEEPRLLEDLKRIGIEIVSTQAHFTDSDCKIISGSCVGIARGFKEHSGDVLLEFKTSNTKFFKQMQKNGVRDSKPIHYVQMNVYMKWANLQYGLYIVVCKETDEIYTEWITFDEETANTALLNAKNIVLSQIPPTKPYVKLSSDCMFCDHKKICWETSLPLLHCRTCMYCKYDLNAQKFTCEQNKTYTDDINILLCDCHKINPYLLTKWLIVDIIGDDFVLKSPFGGVYDTRSINSLDMKIAVEQESEQFYKI